MIAKIAAASGVVCGALFLPSPRPRSVQGIEDAVQSSYSAFVANLNALSTSVTKDVWTSDVVVRLLGVEVDEVPDPGFAKAAVDDIAVLHVDEDVAIAAVTRSLHWQRDDGTESDAFPDAVLAVLLSGSGQEWRVTYQQVVPPGGRPIAEAAAVDAVRSQVVGTLEAILKAASVSDKETVSAYVTPRRCRLLSGEIGEFLRGSMPSSLTAEGFEVLTASSDVCVARAEMKTHRGHYSADGRLGAHSTVSGPPTLFVFGRVGEAKWRLDAEIAIR